MEAWDTVHRWNWFRSQDLREEARGKSALTDSIRSLLEDLERSDASLLDCSCGLGAQASSLREAGLRVTGSDRSRFAVERARQTAHARNYDIDFFVSLWDELPERTSQRFEAVFCDALTWLPTSRELLAALRGLRGILQPDGVVIFQGFPIEAGEEQCRHEVEEWWDSAPRGTLDWRHTQEGVTCTAMSVGSRGRDWIDWHLLYLIEEERAQRLEHLRLRESTRWHGKRLGEVVREAGFSSPATYRYQAWSPGGRPAGLNFATAEPE